MEARWSKLHSNENYKVLSNERGDRVLGWVVMIDGKWIARTHDAVVRADFDTMEDAEQFLTVMVNAREGESDG